MESKETKKGILIAFVGALLITPDTLFMRLSFMDVWTMLFWRGIQMGIVLILITICIKEYRKKFKEIFTKTGIYIILSQAIGSIFFTYGVATSSVALILLCIASSPLFASFFSYFLLKEKVKNHNAKSKKKVTLSQLKKVYRRGAGAFSSSHRPGMSRGGWAMARVNMFLKMKRGGKVKDSYRKADGDI